MNVARFLASRPHTQPADITGWLVVVDGELYLLDDNLSSDYKQTIKIKVADKALMYPIRQAILPLGGGESFVFHMAKLKGYVSIDPSPEIRVEKLWIQESGQPHMISVDISKDSIDAAKQRYEAALNFDFFKEMGDR